MQSKRFGYVGKLCLLVLVTALVVWGNSAVSTDEKVAPTHIATPKTSPPAPKPAELYQFPAGGRNLFPKYCLVALYGTPHTPVLGALGAQDLPHAIARAKSLARAYRPHTSAHVLPTLEIISTVASASPTENGDYSQEIEVASLRPWVKAAQKAGVYVVLDLQSGRTSFLKQAKQYEPLLREPNVGLALDPEWRLGPHQVPLVQIGQVSIKEVNATAVWLAALTKRHHLPQKLFLLHQFRLDMLPNRDKLNTSHKQLAYAIQMDGQGSQPQKAETWRVLTAHPLANTYFGWKNFYHKDSPVLSPAQTMRKTPKPQYISYQ